MNVTPEQAIQEIDKVIAQTNGPREYHLFMAACLNAIRAAIAPPEAQQD